MFLIVHVYSKTGFVKDQSMDIVFPARNIQKIEDVPLGHLRPVGKYIRIYNECGGRIEKSVPRFAE